MSQDRTQVPSNIPEPRVIERFPAGSPRGSWPAEEFAAARRAEGLNVTVVMNLAEDAFLVKAVTA
jgi:hypothetical protein